MHFHMSQPGAFFGTWTKYRAFGRKFLQGVTPPPPPWEVVVGISSPNSAGARFSAVGPENCPERGSENTSEVSWAGRPDGFSGENPADDMSKIFLKMHPPLPRGRWWRGFLARNLGSNLPSWGNLSPFDPETVPQFLEIQCK